MLLAVQIGEFLGKAEVAAQRADVTPADLPQGEAVSIPVIEDAPEQATRPTPRGFRARLRQETAPVRFR